MNVKKKDSSIVPWDSEFIKAAVRKASIHSKGSKITDAQLEQLLQLVLEDIEKIPKENNIIPTKLIHEKVLSALEIINQDVYLSYRAYRNYKQTYSKAFKNAKEFAEKVVFVGDKENANKDSALNATKQTLIAEGLMRELMLKFELAPQWAKAHEEGWIHIHDLAQRYSSQVNCCLFDIGNVLSGGFELNGSKYTEPKTIQAAWAVAGDVTLSASSNQLGGFTLPEIDTVLAPYAKKSYIRYVDYYFLENGIDLESSKKMAMEQTLREIYQGYQGFETKLNTISNSLAQVPFVTITFGLDISFWARKISEIILETRKEGMGNDKQTAIFPKLVFIHRKDINGQADTPNYDLYQKAIDCSKTRLYPDYLSLDGENNNLREVYERSGKVVSGMGCRAYLSPFYHPDTGEEIYTGRSNIGAVTLNLPKMAIESKGNLEVFYQLVNDYSKIVFDIHEDYYQRAGKIKGSSNPLMFCEGGAWKKVGYDEPVSSIIEASTASLGYVGLEETCQSLFETSLYQNQGFAIELVQHLKELVNEYSVKYNRLFALYSTPAESLIYKFNKLNQEQYGLIHNVTNREYITNSFHLHVTQDVSVPEKILFETPFHAIATGGRISYCEFPYGVDNNVLKSAIDFAMSNGLYYGVNVISANCSDCGHKGDFETCPKCLSDNVTSVSRVCGYLSFGKIKGSTRYNLGKQAEVRDRVKHTIGYGERLNTISAKKQEESGITDGKIT